MQTTTSVQATASSSTTFHTPSRKRFQDVAPAHLPALVLDAEGNVQHLSASARRLLEVDADGLRPTCFFSHVHARNLYQVMRDVADMVCHGKPSASWLMGLRTGQGRWRWFKALAQNELASHGAIVVQLQDV